MSKYRPRNYSERVIEIRLPVKKAEKFMRALRTFEDFLPEAINSLERQCDYTGIKCRAVTDKLNVAYCELDNLYYTLQDAVENDPMPGRGK